MAFVPGYVYMGPSDLKQIAEAAPPTPDVGYVYFLIGRAGTVLYIGQSHNPAKRLLAHRQNKQKREWRSHIKWVQIWADYQYAVTDFENWQIKKIQPRYNHAGTTTRRPITPELAEMATILNCNPEWIRGTINGGPCAGEIGNYLACNHQPGRTLCGDPACEAASALEALALLPRRGE